MQVDAKVQEAINAQINHELASFYNYLAMAAYFEATPYRGFAHWMRIQAEEEKGHALKLFDYLNNRRAAVRLKAIPQPEAQFAKPLDVFERSLAQEQEVSGQIHDLYETAQGVRDYTTMNFLGWFLDEQVEEEKITSDMVDRLRIAGDDPDALLRLDKEAELRAAAGG